MKDKTDYCPGHKIPLCQIGLHTKGGKLYDILECPRGDCSKGAVVLATPEDQTDYFKN